MVAIVSTWSDLNTCHTHLPERVGDIKRGILRAGGVAAELPALSLGEQLMKPSAMMFRNLLAMQTEEMLRAQPVDAAVLIGGCDKTTPGVLMGAISANLPCIYLPAGAMLRGHYRGETLGSGTDVWRHWDEKRAGRMGRAQWLELEEGIRADGGDLYDDGDGGDDDVGGGGVGVVVAGGGVDSGGRFASPTVGATGRGQGRWRWRRRGCGRADLLSRDSFVNATAAVVLAGGSTNAIIHLTALARRAGLAWRPADFAAVADGTPLLLNLKPSGEFVMEDFHRAGGSLALFRRGRRFFSTAGEDGYGQEFCGECARRRRRFMMIG